MQKTMTYIDTLTEEYANARDALTDAVMTLQAEIDAAKREHMALIRHWTAKAGEYHDKLHGAISETPALFEKPRTRVMHGVRVGYTKQRGQVVIDDEESTLKRIRVQLPKDQADLLIRTRESVHKPAVYDLCASDLKRLGIRIDADTDKVVIKPVDSEVDKLVAALLEEAQQVEEDAT